MSFETLRQTDDLHAENNEEGGECPTGITHCLGRSKSHSTGKEMVINTELLHCWLSLAAIGRRKLIMNTALNHSTAHWHALPDTGPLSCPSQRRKG
jgi:hypothetical protein